MNLLGSNLIDDWCIDQTGTDVGPKPRPIPDRTELDRSVAATGSTDVIHLSVSSGWLAAVSQ
jgi:hypothetical protein